MSKKETLMEVEVTRELRSPVFGYIKPGRAKFPEWFAMQLMGQGAARHVKPEKATVDDSKTLTKTKGGDE